ncbi:hypothetical protein T01_2788 [Trichinella spiralis]|uniref:Uncharacterized protein n=1 Tax=Trichinella spiralis TaxID=6334 RepID=A0A0V1AX21_TRISP|nr:hypothetical protein T01_2788 [Trichinella spiralis]
MGVVNLSEIGLHLKQHSVAILSRNRTLTALPGTRTPNMLYDILSDMKNDNEYQNCVHYYQRCLFVNKIVVNIRSSEVSNLRDCRWNASSTSRRSNLSLKSLLKLFSMKKQENSCYGSVQLGG